MKQVLTALIFIMSLTYSNAQDYDFGEISKAELQEKFHPKDSAAPAAILYRKEEIRFFYSNNEGFIQEREMHMRIKVYNKDGFDWATKKVYLYQGTNQREQITGIKGVSYNLVNGKIEKEKLKSDGKFEEDYNDYTKISSFTMPSVKEGTVIEYKYKVSSPRISIDDILFQFSVPVNKLEVTVGTPEYYVYNKQLNLRAKFVPQIEETFKNTKVPFEYRINILAINEDNIPAIREEAFSGSISNYRSKMALELTATLNNMKQLTRSYTTSWEDVSKTIYESDHFGGQLGKFSIYKEDLDKALAGIEGDFEKAFAVEKLVKSKVKWNEGYGKYTSKGVRVAYKEGEGNSADINLMMVSMLRSQGVNANPVLVSTRNNGIPLFPTREGFNYVICSVQSGDAQLLLDATEEYSTENVLPTRVLNWQGRLIENNKVSRWIPLQPKKMSVMAAMLNVSINDDFSISGKLSKQLTNYNAYFYRNRYAKITSEDHMKSLEKDKGDIEINALTFNNADDVSKPVKIGYEYELSDGIDEVGNKLYFSPLFFLATKENPFKLDEREYPVDFVIPNSDKYLVNIMLPKGYNVESLPNSEVIAFKDANVKFSYLVKQNGNFIQLKAQLDIVNPLILPSDYKDFKAFYGKIVEKQTEQIVLTKV
ncbi:transglutaminase domain-containing protein [Winogradskyella arenosi]|uniref:Transglutaminase superfamily protein n=1 Tax=Winogradskyella arenosi TaxID=533325 RepID=A0A368ZQ75_9FLAO|nr:transglutaminase domain-containing protein [Winogradskyella arenosi]RCW94083.1 transglutaminase superfamily protein [Winogradskyella arenosi]